MQIKEETDYSGPHVLVFGGTIEGRRVCEYLAGRHAAHTVCVATEYGEEVLQPQPGMRICQGRMNMEEMRVFLREGSYAMVVDATHPYAVEVSRNIQAACQEEHVPYLRYLRSSGRAECTGGEENAVYVSSTREAAEYLEMQQGGIFLTTGSKELHVFTEILSDKGRLFARVLPSAEVVASCRALGLEGKQICAMQGPFSAAVNEAMLRQTGSAFLVTKDTGASGGFPEKMEAVRSCGITAVIIRRPQETGAGWDEVQKRLDAMLAVNSGKQGCAAPEPRRISCIGIGMGTPATLTRESAAAMREAQILFGAKRILESARLLFEEDQNGAERPEFVPEYRAEKIREYLDSHPQYRRAAILMSGDVGFYSGARQVTEVFQQEAVRYYCGISSIVYFASRVPTSWQDAKLLSAHGKDLALPNYVKRYRKIILLVSGPQDVERLCGELCTCGLERVRVTVGTNLSYPEETVTAGCPADFLHCQTKGLHIMMVENAGADFVITPGIPDDAFTRGRVPMTKEEIRILSVAKLRLREDSVVFDVGAGTGSVAVECARLCTEGAVYAVERNPEGIALIRENSKRLGVSNLIAVEGTAPQALYELPAPTHAFIGGSAGNMREILAWLREKNPAVRIVINTIALESIAEVTELLREMEIPDADIVQIAAAKSRVLGKYHMMTANNPVYVISFGGSGNSTADFV